MVSFRFIFIFVSVMLNLSNAVKVDMKGSLSLGKEVVTALRTFVNTHKISGRRSFNNYGLQLSSEEEPQRDTVALIVHSSFICREIDFCNGENGNLLTEYTIMLTKAVESVFEGLIEDTDKNYNQNTLKAVIFESELKRLIREIKKMIRNANEKINEDNVTFIWIDLVKRINAKFQDAAITFASHKLEGNVQEMTEVKNKLTQKLVIATTLIELKFMNKFCKRFGFCSKSHEITKVLNTLLVQLIALPDHKIKDFIRQFYETLPTTNFYYRISDITGHEFQTILHDMAYADNIPAKNILALIQKIVEERLNNVESNAVPVEKPGGRDVKLVHIMLSDMDHFYSKHKKEPYFEFMDDFFQWTKTGEKFNSQLRRVMKDLQNNLSFESDELVYKLVNEMRVFMEITVDPDPDH